jgi:peptide/nickel transport system permease protein
MKVPALDVGGVTLSSRVAKLRRVLGRTRWPERVALGGVIVITLGALLAPLLAPHDPLLPAGAPLEPPSLEHPFGTDDVGRDLLTRVLFGIRLTWFPALVVVALGILVGSLIGVISGTYGGWTDRILQRLTELFLVMPSALIAIAVVAAIGPGLWNTVMAISIFWWPWYSRLVRGEVKAIGARPHVEAARLAKVSRWRLLTRYLLPGAVPIIVVTATLDVANVILVVSLFSFLGLGAPAPAPELGATTAGYLHFLTTAWWLPMFPAIVIFLLAYCSNLAGDGIRDMLETT